MTEAIRLENSNESIPPSFRIENSDGLAENVPESTFVEWLEGHMLLDVLAYAASFGWKETD